MNNDYSLNSYQGETSKLHLFQKTRIYAVFTNPMYIVCIILFICIVVALYWNYIRPNWYKQIYEELLLFEGFKNSHLTNQEIEATREDGLGVIKDSHNNSHFIIYGSSGSGKTYFLKHYLKLRTAQQQVKSLVLGRDEREFPLKILYYYCSWRILVLNNLLIRLL